MKMSVRAERDSCNTEVRRSGRVDLTYPPPAPTPRRGRTGVLAVPYWCRTQDMARSTRYTSTPYAQARRPLVYRSEDGFGKKLTNGRGRCQPGGGTSFPSRAVSVTVCRAVTAVRMNGNETNEQ